MKKLSPEQLSAREAADAERKKAEADEAKAKADDAARLSRLALLTGVRDREKPRPKRVDAPSQG